VESNLNEKAKRLSWGGVPLKEKRVPDFPVI